MGQGDSKPPAIDRHSLLDEEYLALLGALGDVEDSPGAVAELSAFLTRFPAHLKPLVQPLFSMLVRPPIVSVAGRPLQRLVHVDAKGNGQDVWDKLEKGTRIACLSAGQVVCFEQEARNSGGASVAQICFPVAGWVVTRAKNHQGVPLFAGCSVSEEELSAPLQALVAGLSRVASQGVTWHELLSAWAGDDAEKAGASVELAAALCFWCAHPGLAPTPAGDDAGSGQDLTAGIVAALRPPASEIAAGLRNDSDGDQGPAAGAEDVARHLTNLVPYLPQAAAHCLSAALLGRAAAAAPPPLDSKILDRGHLLALRGMTAQMATERWHPLFRDWKDGRSFREMLKCVLHYAGLAVVVLQAETGEIFGGVSNCWEDMAGKFGGTGECLLFALEPALRVLRPQGRSESYAYINARNEYAPRGLGFGGRVESFRLWLDSDLNSCTVLAGDATYGFSKLLPSSEYQVELKISRIEVWGIAGRDAMEAQDRQRGIKEGLREKARVVDRARMCETDFDKEMLFGNTFAAAADARDKDPN